MLLPMIDHAFVLVVGHYEMLGVDSHRRHKTKFARKVIGWLVGSEWEIFRIERNANPTIRSRDGRRLPSAGTEQPFEQFLKFVALWHGAMLAHVSKQCVTFS